MDPREEVAAFIRGLPLGRRVLDVGTGFGYSLGMLLSMGLEVHSVDPDEEALERARKVHGESVRLYRAGAEELPFPDGYFDSAVSIFSLHHFSDIPRAIAEIERVTRGIVALVDWAPSAGGLYNPHGPEELARAMELAMRTRPNYRRVVRGYWYALVRERDPSGPRST